MTDPVLTIAGVSKTYGGVRALSPVSLRLVPGELAVLIGPSGSGKSTLLMIAGGWETPDQGTVTTHPPLPGGPVSALSWRHIGFVPQSISLFDELSIADNLTFAGRSNGERDTAGLLTALGLARLADRLPAELSRGEQQRAAVARALAAGASVVLADEPTSHQDRHSGADVLTVLRATADRGASVLIASHDPIVRDYADREIDLGG